MTMLAEQKDLRRQEWLGLAMAFIGIACFSVTLPATRLGVAYVDPVLFGLGRSLFVALPALLTLWWLRAPRPDKKQLKDLILVSLGVVIGFPWLSAVAMESVSGAQAGIISAVLPLFTAIAGAVLTGQRPSLGFWLMGLVGSGLVLLFVWDDQQGGFHSGDLTLMLSAAICAVGYAAGGRLAKEMGGMAVICWAVLLSVPLSLGPVLWKLPQLNWDLPWQVWASFLYVDTVIHINPHATLD